MIRIYNISKSYNKKEVLKNISIDLDNKIYGLLGPNGSGKTTLLRIIPGILKSEGKVVFEESLDEPQIGYLPQKYGVFKEMTIYEQMNYYAILKKIPKKIRKENIEDVLLNVNLPDFQIKCGNLSGGMIRRLGIAQTYLGTPDVILLDEPSVGLDLEERLRFQTILAQSQRNCPIIISTHIVEDVEHICDDIIVLKGGKIIFIGTRQEIKDKANNHTFILDKNTYHHFKEPHYVMKILNDDEQEFYRIICDSNDLDQYKVDPKLEDGYMYLIKGPFV